MGKCGQPGHQGVGNGLIVVHPLVQPNLQDGPLKQVKANAGGVAQRRVVTSCRNDTYFPTDSRWGHVQVTLVRPHLQTSVTYEKCGLTIAGY